MEKLKMLPNGQWKLEKALTAQTASKIRNWMHSGMREHLKNIPKLEGKHRAKTLKSIESETESRINPESGEKEYKLYRASRGTRPFEENNLSSWTTRLNMAHYWGNIGATPGLHDPDWKSSGRMVHHAWIPEKHVHSHLNVVAGKNHEKGGENEVLIEPHKVNIIRSEKPKDPTKV